MMHDGIVRGMGLGHLLLIALVVLATTAWVKYVFFR